MLSVSVEWATECQMRVNDVFCAVSLSGNASLQLADPCLAHFLGCLSTFCDTHGSKVPAILRDWQALDAERAVFGARSTKVSKGERSGEHGG